MTGKPQDFAALHVKGRGAGIWPVAGLAAREVLEAAGVARISYAPSAWFAAMQEVTQRVKGIYAQR